jgi:hypothetical protein
MTLGWSLVFCTARNRPGAVVAGPDRDALVQQLSDVVRVDARL